MLYSNILLTNLITLISSANDGQKKHENLNFKGDLGITWKYI